MFIKWYQKAGALGFFLKTELSLEIVYSFGAEMSSLMPKVTANEGRQRAYKCSHRMG